MAGVGFVGVVVVMPALLDFVNLGRGFEWLIRVLVYVLALSLLLVALDVLYRWGPYREQHKYRWLTPGSVLAVIGIAAVSLAFSWYTAHVSNYNATYGSLGALIGLPHLDMAVGDHHHRWRRAQRRARAPRKGGVAGRDRSQFELRPRPQTRRHSRGSGKPS